MTIVAAPIPRWKESRRQRQTAVKIATNDRPQPIKVPDSVVRQVRGWLEELRPHINTIIDLRPGWAGSRSHPVNIRIVWKLLTVLADLGASSTPVPDLVPLQSGGVQAEWHFGSQSIEVGISSDGEIFAFATTESGEDLVELEDTRFIPSDVKATLRRSLSALAKRVEDRGR